MVFFDRETPTTWIHTAWYWTMQMAPYGPLSIFTTGCKAHCFSCRTARFVYGQQTEEGYLAALKNTRPKLMKASSFIAILTNEFAWVATEELLRRERSVLTL